MKALLNQQAFSLHPSAFIPSIWPDSGLTRNTRCRCYRCSVPGLAGFTRRALCGARSLIKITAIVDCQFPNVNQRIQIRFWATLISCKLDLRLAMREQSQQTVYRQVQ